jgi:hypothetical protein
MWKAFGIDAIELSEVVEQFEVEALPLGLDNDANGESLGREDIGLELNVGPPSYELRLRSGFRGS